MRMEMELKLIWNCTVYNVFREQQGRVMANRVSTEQLEVLLEFLQENPAIAKGVGLGPRSKETVDRQWNELASKLNSIGSGSSKTGDRWKKYWADIKHKSKTRLARYRRDSSGTGGGPSTQEDLSEIDKKILSIIGEHAVYGDVEHRVPIFEHIQNAPIAIETCQLPNELTTHDESEEIAIIDNQGQCSPVVNLSSIIEGQPSTIYLSQAPGTDTSIAMTANQQGPASITRTGLESPVSRPIRGRRPLIRSPLRRHRSRLQNTETRSRVDPEWIMQLEERRVEAELALAEASRMQAEASQVQAEASRMQAEASMIREQTFRLFAETLREINDRLPPRT